ncbi:putative ATP-dependent RNA helicase DHX35 [Capsicum baccatum]|uniref:RNA helicase n=1 Tax=Capsicum baccatum TaxID=33114 RepID=A0A2G2UYR0_CAPBA|nr:putative ATP-dependent RNA helicase DHX35 [Capsicum baccatum]
MSQFWKPGSERPRLVDDEEGGVLLYATSSSSSSSGFGYGSLEKQRQRLPVYKYKTAILYSVETHATTIIVGETGSGKTTQIPQYLKEAGWAEGGRMIACTQPRRLAVQAVATRVAEEMDVKLGEEVGYTIRFEDITNEELTRVKFLTDGVLLREMMDDPLLSKYSVIMVDEAHERSLSTDILLGLLKKIQRCRPELRIIISSATIEAKSMAAFFNTSALPCFEYVVEDVNFSWNRKFKNRSYLSKLFPVHFPFSIKSLALMVRPSDLCGQLRYAIFSIQEVKRGEVCYWHLGVA